MSLLRQSDYNDASKKNKVKNPHRASHGGIATPKKVSFPTKYRTKKSHKCFHCERTDAQQYSISEKETRWLCPECVIKNTRKDVKEIPHFIKASKLGVKK